MSEEIPILLRDVSFGYTKKPVLEDISFDVPKRSVSCLIGPNGGGKSTLLKLIMGLIKPDSGEIRVLGLDPVKARTRVGYMPQSLQFDPLFPVTVESIVRMGTLVGNLPGSLSSEANKAVEQVLEEVEIRALRNERFSELSGGQKQRVLIARALVCRPDILLLDEPTAMVDAHVEARLLEHLRELHQRMTLLLVSHDASFVSNLVDQVLCVNQSLEIHPVDRNTPDWVNQLYGHSVHGVDHHHEGSHD